MAKISAFVGHSFTDEDEEVVRRFTDFFTQMATSGIGFDWDHAREAEPKELADKVLSLIEGKNLFIGICTRKERAVAPGALRKRLFGKYKLGLDEADLAWKTSDWVIQEIGLAVGRDMDLILLVEKGVRRPGGLQGDIEYIEFDRKVPEKSFGRIFEMVSALLPKAVSAPPVEAESPPVSDEHVEETQASNDSMKPQEDWEQRDYAFALMRAIAIDDADNQKQLKDAYLQSIDSHPDRTPQRWKLYQEHFRLSFEKGGRIDRLEEAVESMSDDAEARSFLAKAYEDFGEHEKAAVEFREAANMAPDPSEKATLLGSAGISLLTIGKDADVAKTEEEIRSLSRSSDNASKAVAEALRGLAEKRGETDNYYALSEFLLQMSPDDTVIRFDLAYQYSKGSQEALSLYHYLRMPAGERSAAAWNNVGVQYEHFKLNSKAVDAYQRAADEKETLAMSNMAYKLINAGFLQKAKELCDKALAEEDYHKNVGSAIARIKEVPEEEGKKEKELIKKSLTYSEFYRRYGGGLIDDSVSITSSRWQGPKCELLIELKDGSFYARGEYDQVRSGLGLAAALGGLAMGSGPATVRRVVSYEGRIAGRSIKCAMKDVEQGGVKREAANTLLTALGEVTVLMVVSETGDQIRVYEKAPKEQGKFYTLTRLDGRDE